jgi:hypothetical protein
VELIVEPTNDAPIAALDTVVLAAGASRVAIDVVRNDFDQDGDALLALLSKGPAHGTLMTPTSAITPSPWRYGGIPDPSGLFYYTPDAGFVGTDQFTYHVTDGLAQSEAVEVTLHVSRATPGDANLDRRVDTEDFWLWLENNFQAGTDWEQANFNGDGVTDVSDFNIWFAHRFTETGEAESAVPRVPRAAAMFAVNLPVPLDGATRLARPSLPLPYEPLNGLSSTVSRRADEALERVAWVRTAERATTNATDTIFAELGSVLLPTWDGNVLVN